jgi:hypothetical protein
MNKTIILVLIFLAGFFSCNRKPFVNAKLKFEKLADNCGSQQNYFKMVSGFAGERYEFEKCLSENFSKENMTASRQGDTVVIRFAGSGGKNILYKMTVDIDSYPKYNFVTVDEETFMVIPTKD